MARAMLAFLLVIGALAAASAYAPAPAPAPAPVFKQCHDVCKDNCFQDVQKKCIDVPYHEQVCVDKPYTVVNKKCEKVCSAPAHGKKGLRKLAQASVSAMALAGIDDDCNDCNDGHYGKGKAVPLPQPICHDVCVDVPVTLHKKECATVTKHRQECKDHITNICKKECHPVCSESKGKGHRH